jgi:hypothetical protein
LKHQRYRRSLNWKFVDRRTLQCDIGEDNTIYNYAGLMNIHISVVIWNSVLCFAWSFQFSRLLTWSYE